MTRPDPESRHIALVVDDNPESLGMVASALEENGMTVLVARDGASAIDLTRRVQPDVILMDAVMPRMDGFETCRRLKAPPDPTPAPIIFMTGLTEPEYILRGLESGGVDYIKKPVVVEELIARLTIHVMNSKLIQSARNALDTSGRSVLAFDRAGHLIWGSPNAIALAGAQGDLIGPEGTAHSTLRAWLTTLPNMPISQITPLQFQTLVLHFVGTTSSGELLIKLQSGSGESNEAALARSFELTDREAEVLFWLTRGKTNRDIGQILSLSARTVNKHLEQVFQKMGVDNRTSAAVLADRVLNSE
ncbi:MAG: DNA-binding response regulator [Pseudomonadota bacterium]|nr:DNA-binding response regulator [Pseudomonadota bacterium]